VFVSEMFGAGKGELLFLRDGLRAREQATNGVQRVDGIDRCWPCFGERFVNLSDVGFELREILAAKGAKALGETVGGGGSDRAGTADDHIGDGARRFLEISAAEEFKFVREQPLLNEHDFVAVRVE